MSDEPSAEVRALAAKLFAAGRAERPGPALGRRLLLIEPPQAHHGAPSPHAGAASPGPRAVVRLPSRVALWLAAAALVAGGAGLWLVPGQEPLPLSISPDPAPGRMRPTGDERLAEALAASEGLEATGGASGTEAAPRGDHGERGAVPRKAPRPPAIERTGSADSAVPPSTAPSAPASSAAPSADPAARVPPMTLRAELELLKRARTALRSGDAAQALELLSLQARERTGNGLGAEATLLRIEALAARGRHGDASELAARFVRDNPNSALGDRAKSFIRSPGP